MFEYLLLNEASAHCKISRSLFGWAKTYWPIHCCVNSVALVECGSLRGAVNMAKSPSAITVSSSENKNSPLDVAVNRQDVNN